jgi:hypothetical protein
MRGTIVRILAPGMQERDMPLIIGTNRLDAPERSDEALTTTDNERGVRFLNGSLVSGFLRCCENA